MRNFIRSQIRLAGLRPKGRRYTLDDKIMGLLLHRQSGRAYKLLSKIFALPSRKTVMSLLNRIPIKCGINETLFDNLRAKVKGLSRNEKHCVLMFDEISTEPHIALNVHTKGFEGFEDLGDVKKAKIADRSLVFMIKGVTREWKQPIMYVFSNGPTKTIDIVRFLKKTIYKLNRVGLNVLATISDQGSNNQAAINYLMISTVRSRDSSTR